MASNCMIKTKVERLFRNFGRIRRRRNNIREGRDSNLLSTETFLAHIIKINLLRMNPRWNTPREKGEDRQSNVGDVIISHVQWFPSQRRKNEDTTQHPLGYYSIIHGKKYSKNICILIRSSSRTPIPYNWGGR